MDIIIKGAQISQCWEFALQAAPNQKPNEFDNKVLETRTPRKIAEDTFVGKLGEIAVQKWLSDSGVKIDLDWAVTPRGQWDVSDISYNDWTIDVKCTKSKGLFFLIDWSKLQFRASAKELPHFFVMTRMKSDLSTIARDGSSDCVVELAGYIDTRELREDNEKIRAVRRGEALPNTNVPMATSNFAVPIQEMNKDWEDLALRLKKEKAFSLEGYVPTGKCSRDEKKRNLPMKYSLLAAGTDVLKYSTLDIECYIKEGIKCLLFVAEGQEAGFEDVKNKYGMLQLYKVKEGNVPAVTIYDGIRDDEQQAAFENLCRLSWITLSSEEQYGFNYEQYDIEHFNINDMLMIKASAGTGKTTVMIDRIMFLLATVPNLRPADIAMTTFTNKATAHMMKKLQARTYAMYDLTKKQRWFEIMEELSQMQLSTIDSFFYDILKSDGSALGYGANSAIKSFVYERKQILGNIVNDIFKEQKSQNFLQANAMPIYEYVNRAFEMWKKLHSQGYFDEEIANMDFGTAVDDEDSRINRNLQEIIKEAEKRYQIFKKEHDAYTMEDIKADMDGLTRRQDIVMRHNKYRFLFIDEFQDTDNSQIRSAAWLQKLMGCQLFVVGDVKQSIYRFRGAKESAFEELSNCLKKNGVPEEQIKERVLNKNYRTVTGVMNAYNELFEQWGKDQLIKWDSRVTPCIEGKGNLRKIVGGDLCSEIKKWKPKVKHICVLTRNNWQVEEVARMCREEDIPCIAKLKGGFYKSEPVRDLHALLGALLYHEDSRRLYNLLLTPYTRKVPDGEKIACMHGDDAQVRQYLESLLVEDDWQEILDKKRVEPFFPMLLKMFEKMQPLERYANMRRSGFPLYGKNADAEYDIEYYQENFNKLLRILYENFTGEYASLLAVFEFLDNKIQTDIEEDCIYPINTNDKCVEIMTVHKAKGLEFDTVMLPYMDTLFFEDELKSKSKVELITDKSSGRLIVGWKFNYNKKERKNNYYGSMVGDEHDAERREEARILYVALTRAMENMICFISDESKDNTWEEYVENCQEVE